MARVTCFLMAGIILSGLAGCQSMPWQKDTMPPVELLDETKAASGEEVAQPVETTTTTTAEKPDTLQMSTNQRISDVPLPAKAKEDLERSYVYESSSLQLGRMVYTVRASVNEIAQFYIDNAPAAGWKLINIKQAEGGAELLFRKEGKKLEVSVIPLGVLRSQRLVLHLVPDSVTGTMN